MQLRKSFIYKDLVHKIWYNDLFRVLVICFLIRLFYYNSLFTTFNHDSASYIECSINIFKGEVDQNRTPVYPLFLKILYKFSNVETFSRLIVVAQSVISFLTIILFYKSSQFLFTQRSMIIGSSILYGISPSLINFDFCILTESLSISFMVTYLFVIIDYTKKPNNVKAFAYTFLTFFAVMLRPSFLMLLPIITLFWILEFIKKRENRRFSYFGFASVLLCCLCIYYYGKLNDRRNNYNGISVVADQNQLSNLIIYDMYMNGGDPEVSNTIKMNIDSADLLFNIKVNNALYSLYSSDRIHQFIRQSIVNDFLKYIKISWNKLFFEVGRKRIAVHSANYYASDDQKSNNASVLEYLYKIVKELNFSSFMMLYLLILLDVVRLGFRFVRYSVISNTDVFILLVCVANLITITVGAQSDFARLFIHTIPIVILILFRYFDLILYSLNRNRLIDYLRQTPKI